MRFFKKTPPYNIKEQRNFLKAEKKLTSQTSAFAEVERFCSQREANRRLCTFGTSQGQGVSLVLVKPKFRQEVPKMRVKITLACTECKQRNYNTKKNKKNDPDRLEMNKYCKFCKKHTLHKETK